jgi:hypothetical protein
MKMALSYAGRSGIVSGLRDTSLAFATNTLRETTYFEGSVSRPLLLREALAALYHVVVSDYHYRPPDRSAYMAWLATQEQQYLQTLGLKQEALREQIQERQARLSELDESRNQRMVPFHRARRAFFEHIYNNTWELNYLLDPVITVHPDEVAFEAFSIDESSYARVAAKHELFGKVGALECGTTNVDFSAELHNGLEKMRTYRQTRLGVDPSGFSVVHQDGQGQKEKKIDLPESWVRGFHQVHSTMCLSLRRVRLDAVDVFNVCRFLRQHRTKVSPRALRYEFTPGQKPKMVLEPSEHEIPITGAEVYQADKPLSVRTWGRDRLQLLGRLIPVAQRFDVYLAGFGLPSVYVADLGPVVFTLALSGWTDQDWTGKTSMEGLIAPGSINAATLTDVYGRLREDRRATPDEIAAKTGLSKPKATAALTALCGVGRGMYDLAGDVFRHRDLFMEPFDEDAANAAAKATQAPTKPASKPKPYKVTGKAKQASSGGSSGSHPGAPSSGIDAQEMAQRLYAHGHVRIIARGQVGDHHRLSGAIKGDDGKVYRARLRLDDQQKLIDAECTCGQFEKVKIRQGPCAHALALRIAHLERL